MGHNILGLVIFIIVITFPFWYGKGKSTPAPVLSLDTPAIAQLKEKRCVEDTVIHARKSHEDARCLARRSRPRGEPPLYGEKRPHVLRKA